MTKRKIAALIMAATMTVGALAGCGGSGSGNAGGDVQGSGNVETQGTSDQVTFKNGDITTIVVEMINYGYDDPDLQMVEDAINEITEAEIGVHVDFMTVPIADMSTKLGLMVAGGEEIDLVCTGLLTTPSKLVAEGLLQPITEYINNSEILSSKAGDLFKALTVNGEVYAYPGTFYTGSSYAWYYDIDLAEEYNIDIPEKIESQDDLTAVFQQVLDSGMPCYAVSLGDGVGGERSYGYAYDGLGESTYGSYGVVLDKINGTEVVDWYETEEYKEQCRIHQEWYEAGYTVPDSLSNGVAVADSMAQGQAFSYAAEYGSGMNEGYYSIVTGKNVGKVPLSDIMIENNSVIGSSWGIPSSSTKADAVIKFAELINSNSELAMLYNYGIEGTHYVKTDPLPFLKNREV